MVVSRRSPQAALPAPMAALPPSAAARRLQGIYGLATALVGQLEGELQRRRKARRRAARIRREGRGVLRCSLCSLPVSSHGGDIGRCKGNVEVPEAWAVESEPKARWVGVPVEPVRASVPVVTEGPRARVIRPTKA